MSSESMWGYHRQPDGKDEWLTPPEMIQSLSIDFDGDMFDLDPCSPILRPWDTAKKHFSIEDDGLSREWIGRVWCNPPYDNRTIQKWVEKCNDHQNCILLVFARTETRFWKSIWNTADAALFLYSRMTFHEFECAKCGVLISQHKPKKTECVFENSGKARKAQWTGGAGSALLAYGGYNVAALEMARDRGEIDGKLIKLK